MKNLSFLLFCVLFATSLFAQDITIKKNYQETTFLSSKNDLFKDRFEGAMAMANIPVDDNTNGSASNFLIDPNYNKEYPRVITKPLKNDKVIISKRQIIILGVLLIGCLPFFYLAATGH